MFFYLEKKIKIPRGIKPSSNATWALSPNHYIMISYIIPEIIDIVFHTWMSFSKT
jgi:hypothetical protein